MAKMKSIHYIYPTIYFHITFMVNKNCSDVKKMFHKLYF